MGLTKISTAGLEDQSVTLDKLPHGTGSTDGKFLRANNGADPSFETISIPSGTTINNNAVNRVITGSGTANTLNAESDFIVNSSNNIGIGNNASFPIYTHVNARNFMLGHGGESTALQIHSSSTTYGGIYFGDVADSSDANSYIGSIEYKHGDDDMRFRTNGSERLRIDSSGTIQVKGDGGNNNKIYGYDGSALGWILGNNNSDDPEFTNFRSGNLKFKTGGTERMRIDSGGDVGIGTTIPNNADSADGGLQIQPNHSNGAPSVHFKRANNGNTSTAVGFVNGSTGVGSITYTNGGTSFNTSSDYRLKENVIPLSDGITRLKTLKPYRFNFIVDANKTVDGFLAHEVTAVPEAITGEKDAVDSNDKPIYQGIDQAKLVPLLTAALQEAVAKIETLETKVAALEAA